MTEKNHLKWVNSLKGFFAIVVLLRHYANGFLPALYTGNELDSKILFNNGKSLETLINVSPIYFLINGGFAVYIFWTLSAFLIGYHYFSGCGHLEMQKKAIKKYFGILFPIILTYFFAYSLMKLNLFFNVQASQFTCSNWLSGFYQFEPTIKNLLWNAFIETFFTANVPYNAVLWTMKFEFIGSIFSIMILQLFGSVKNRKPVYFMIAILISTIFPIQYQCFLIGILLSDIYIHKQHDLSGLWSYVLLLLGFWGGCFPSDFWPKFRGSEKIPANFSLFYCHFDVRSLIYCISAGLIIAAIMNGKKSKTYLRNSFFEAFGKSSLGIYMLHLIVECSFSSWIFCILIKLFQNYTLSIFFMFITSFAVIFIGTKIFNIITAKWNRFLNKQVITFLS